MVLIVTRHDQKWGEMGGVWYVIKKSLGIANINEGQII